MFLILIRTIKEGWINFLRNGSLSVAAVITMLLSLFVLGLLFVVVSSADKKLKNIQENTNISVFFKLSVSEDSIMNAKKDLENFNEVKLVTYTSKEEALERFKKNNEKNEIVTRSLEEIGENPLLSYLVVKATNPDRYGAINEYLESAPFKEDIHGVNYQKNKPRIDELNSWVVNIRKIGLGIAGIFSLVSIMIIFNTIKITIYTHRQEVEVMRLVGASNTYIKLPFIFEGIIYGFLAALLSTGLLFVSIKFASTHGGRLASDFDPMAVYLVNLVKIFGVQFLVGALLGIVSSMIAIRKYLKI